MPTVKSGLARGAQRVMTANPDQIGAAASQYAPLRVAGASRGLCSQFPSENFTVRACNGFREVSNRVPYLFSTFPELRDPYRINAGYSTGSGHLTEESLVRRVCYNYVQLCVRVYVRYSQRAPNYRVERLSPNYRVELAQ